MIKKASQFFNKLASTPVTAVSFITILLFIVFVLPGFNSLSSGMGMPDKLFYYDGQTLGQIAQAYGPEGRHLYVRCALTYDLAWPMVYVGFLCIAISWCNNFSLSPDSRIKGLNLVPLICGLFDGLENISLVVVMQTFPKTMDILLEMPGLFTAGKWVCAGLSFLILLGSLVHAAQRGFTQFLGKS